MCLSFNRMKSGANSLTTKREQMITSESITKISAALLKAQKEITFASKDAMNPHFKNRYADLPAVIDAVKPALNNAGIVFIQSASPCTNGTLALTTRLLHESGEWIQDTAVIPLQKNDPQGYGSAMSYARRYSLAAITGLYQDDDDGNLASATNKPTATKLQQKVFLTEAQIADLKLVLEDSGISENEVCAAAKVEKISNIESSRFDGMVKWIKSQKKAG